MHLVWKAGILFFSVSKQGPRLTTIEEDGGEEGLLHLEVAYEDDGVEPLDPV